MDNIRNVAIFAVFAVAVLFGWPLVSNHFFPTANPPATQIVDGKSVPLPNPTAPAATTPSATRDRAIVLAETPRVLIETPRLQGSINLRGARIDDLVLRTHRETIAKNSPPIRLLSPAGAPDTYFAGFGWSGDGTAMPGPNTVWTATGTRLTPSSPVTLNWTSPTGQLFTIRLSVDANYMFTVEQSVTNRGTGAISARPWSLVSRVGVSKDPSSWTNHVGPMGVFDGRANYSVDFKDVEEAGANGERFTSKGGWAGFTDKYWLTAVIPDQESQVEVGFRAGAGNSYQADFTTAPAIVAPGATVRSTSRLFAGAKEVDLLDGYEESLGIARFGKAIDWGWFEIVEKPIFDVLHWLFRATGNFGVAIILLTCLVRGLMFPVAQKQFKSMAAMRVLQPKMKALQERYKDDKAKLQQEMLAMYQKEKVNPVAGCLPILLQIPIFYALYKVLMITIEMRHQPFALWIHDLSAPDPMTPVNLFGLLPFTPPSMIAIGVLPILLGITMYLQFKLNPQPMDDMQKQVFSIMPWIFMFIMAPFAAGLQLYWTVSNLLTIAQQKFLYSRYPGMPADAK